jgi:hypothetical protein
MKKTFLIILAIAVFFAGQAFAAQGLTSGDQTIRGNKTFEHDAVFNKNVTVEGALLGVDQYSSVFYVDSTTGLDSGTWGGTYLKPFATVDYAIGQATADKGDIIYVMPSHTETFTAADGFDADVAGVTIIGLGTGDDRPTFNFTDTDATVAIGAANVTLKNLRFVAGISAVVIGVAVEAGGDGAVIDNCAFPEPATSTFEFLDAIDLATTANDVRITNNEYYHTAATGPAHFIEAGNGTNHNLYIANNIIYGQFSVAAIWSDAIDLRVYVGNNVINNMTAAQHAIEFTTTATGFIVDNFMVSATFADTLDSGSMYVSGNKLAFALDSGSWDIPATNMAHRSVVKSDGAVLTGDDDLFIITGGPVRARITGIVTEVIGDNAANGDLQIDVTEPAGTVDLNAAPVAITSDAAGTAYWNLDSTSVFTPTTAGTVVIDVVAAPEAYFVLPVGTVIFRSSAANTGVIQWTMSYEALSPNSMVVAAP